MSTLVAVTVLLLVVVVLSRVVRVRVRADVAFRDLRAFAREFEPRATEYMRCNYSGDPAQLEGALSGLVPIAKEIAGRQPTPIPDDVVRTAIVATLAAHRVAPRGRIEAALASVMGPEQRAA